MCKPAVCNSKGNGMDLLVISFDILGININL